jgi:hypothetical protein
LYSQGCQATIPSIQGRKKWNNLADLANVSPKQASETKAPKV